MRVEGIFQRKRKAAFHKTLISKHRKKTREGRSSAETHYMAIGDKLAIDKMTFTKHSGKTLTMNGCFVSRILNSCESTGYFANKTRNCRYKKEEGSRPYNLPSRHEYESDISIPDQ